MAENILTKILEHKKLEVTKQQQRVSLEELQQQIQSLGRPRNFFKAVTKPPTRAINLIAEIKRSSPSVGLICKDFDPTTIAKQYHQGGADAISVLTDEKFFGGSLDYIKQVKEVVSVPVMRKDFIIDPYQLYESRAAGADAVLLIAEALAPGLLMDLLF